MILAASHFPVIGPLIVPVLVTIVVAGMGIPAHYAAKAEEDEHDRS